MKLARFSSLLFVPLAFCAAVPQADVYEIKEDSMSPEALQLMQEQQELFTVQQNMAIFLQEASRLTNEAIREQTELLQMENGPTNLQELLDMMFSTEAINRAQGINTTTTVENPLQSLINGIGSAVNGVAANVGNAINSVTNPPKQNVTLNFPGTINTTAPTNPLSGIINGVGSLVTGITGGVGNIVGDVVGDVVGVGNNKTGGLVGLVGGIANTTGSLLSNVTSGIINTDVVNGALSIAGKTIGGILSGTLSVPDAISQVVGFVSKTTGAENPLGKFLQSVATYLSNNQDGVVANAIKFSSFVAAVINTFMAIIKNSFGNITEGIAKSIQDFIIGLIGKLLTGKLFGMRLQDIPASDYVVYKNVFLDSMRAESPAAASYAQQLFELLNNIVNKVLAVDPFILSVLSEPTEDSIRKAIMTISQVLTENTVPVSSA